jgi:uncharacterized protein (UPF0210 family)
MTKERTQQLAALADAILAESGVDVMSQRVEIRPLAKLMQARCDAHYETCKRHIKRAVRRAKGETAGQWGGPRPGAGRPKEEKC